MSPRLGAAVLASPTGSVLLDLCRADNVHFSTNERGFASFSCHVRMTLREAFYLYDRQGLPHVSCWLCGGIVWEGRLEDVTIRADGIDLTALGYIRGYADAPYSASHIGVTASSIVQALVAAASGVNSFMSSSTVLVQDPGVTLAEIYEDRYPVEILDRLCALGDSQTPPRLWEAGVFENRVLHFRPRGNAARKWYVDVAEPNIERTLELLYNSVYVVYQEGGNQRTLTGTSSDTQSVTRYGLTRRTAVGLQTTDGALAVVVRNAALNDGKDPAPRAGLTINRVFDQNGAVWPLPWMRSGDQVTVRNLPPTASVDIDRIRTFRVKETQYNAVVDVIDLVPEALLAGISPQANASRILSISDPNLQYQHRPTLAELYADFKGLLGLRGLWYPGSTDNAGALYDQTGQGRTLTYNGNPTLNVYGGFIPYYDYDATGDFHSRADEAGLDMLGTETVIAAAARGFTIGGWFWADAAAPIAGLISKFSSAAGGQSYALRYTGSNTLQFLVGDGVNSFNVISAASSFPNGSWVFGVGRFTPSTVIDVFTNGVKVSNSTSIPAAILNSAQQLELARLNSVNGQLLDGRIAIAFLCGALIADTQLNHLFERTRKFFGV